MRGRMVSAFMAVLFLTAGAASAGQLELTREGKPTATIVVGRNPARAALWAAHDLQRHVQMITGATLPIRADGIAVEGRRILVGESVATRAMGIKAEDFKKQEYLIRFLPDTLVLMGRDDKRADTGMKPGVVVTGEPKWTDGRFGRGLAFQGGEAVTVSRFQFPDAEGTLEAWVWMPAEPSPTIGTILRLDGSDPWSYHIVQRQVNTRRIQYVTYVEQPKSSGSVVSKELAAGWHHVAATYSVKTGRIELFVDGVSQGVGKYAMTTCDGSALQIGGIARAGAQVANPLTGKVDEIRISSVLRVPPKDAPAAPVAPDGDTRLLMHLDEGRGAPEALSFGPAPEPDPPAMFEEQGTCYAVYDFLERFCGVRWFNPTDFGTDYPSTKTLVVQGAEVRRAPFFRFRQVHPAGLRYDSGTGLWHVDSDGYRRYDEAAYAELHKKWPSAGAYTRAKRRQMDAFLCRMRAGGEASVVNHSFYGYYDRFLKTNPDWFAKGYEGRSPQLCYTNPEVIRQVVQDARDFFDGKPVPSLPGFLAPGSDYFPLEPMDNSRYCQCDRCKPWIRERESYTGWSNGVHSDYIFQFVNEVARQVRQTHPNKWVAILAYHSHTAVPQRVKIEPNVIVHFCFACNRLFYDRLEYENELRLFNEWVTREKGRPLYLWLYYTFPTEIAWHSKGAWHAFPGYFVHTLDRQFKMFHQHGLRGMFHCGYGQEVEAYVTLRLMDDPTLDAEALLDEYFSRLYGAAAKPLKEFYLKVEDAYSTPARYPPEFFVKCHEKGQPGHQTEEIAWGHLGTPKLMDELGKLMASAKDLAKSDLEKARVRLFEKAVWDYLVESRRKYDARAAEREQRKAFEPKREAMRQAAPPKVRVPRVTVESPADPSKLDWSKAAHLSPWFTVEGYPTQRKLDGRLFHDGRNLYLRLAEQVQSSGLVNAKDIFTGDDWEVFLAAARSGSYIQYAINPAGAFYANPTAEPLKPHVRAISSVQPDRWDFYLILPLDKLLPGKPTQPGMAFYANFYRAVNGQVDLLAWSPNFTKSFHVLSRMGEFVLETTD